jgi:hypothetical protein
VSETHRRSPDDSRRGSGERPAEILDQELENATGQKVDDGVARGALDEPAPTFASTLSANKLLVGITFAVVVVVGAILALATDAWWAVVLAALVHATATVIVIGVALRLTSQVEKPDPATVARLEDAGVADPEAKMNQAIRSMADDEEERPEAQILEENQGDPSRREAHDPADDIVQQQVSNTPSSDRTSPQDKG